MKSNSCNKFSSKMGSDKNAELLSRNLNSKLQCVNKTPKETIYLMAEFT